MQAARVAGRQRRAARDRVGIAVDRPDRAGSCGQDRGRVAAAPERAVEIDAALPWREVRQHLLEQHGGMAGKRGGHCVFPGKVMPRLLARSRASARRRAAASGSQNLEDAAETHEHHGAGQPGMGDQRLGEHDPALLVRLHGESVRVQGGGEVVMLLAEDVEPLERRGQLLEDAVGPSLDAGVGMGRPEHDLAAAIAIAPRVVAVEGPERGAKRRRDGNPPLRVQPVLVSAQELGHPPRLSPFPCCRRLAQPDLGTTRSAWDGVG